MIMTKPLDNIIEMTNENTDQKQKLKVNNDDEFSPKRCSSSTFLEKRKRSLAHNSDDEVIYLSSLTFLFIYIYLFSRISQNIFLELNCKF